MIRLSSHFKHYKGYFQHLIANCLAETNSVANKTQAQKREFAVYLIVFCYS